MALPSGAGELASLCDSEESNFLTLNLADEIMAGRKDALEARYSMSRIKEMTAAGKTSPYTQSLLFRRQ